MQATASASPRNLSELDLNELYRIRVRAYTSAGSGPYSNEIRVMTREDGECRADSKAIAIHLYVISIIGFNVFHGCANY